MFSFSCILAVIFLIIILMENNIEKLNDKIVILFGSKSQKKLNALKTSTDKIFKDMEVTILLYDVNSDINSQPLNEKETLQGAINRLKNTIKAHESSLNSNIKWDYVIGIENGIIEVKNDWLIEENKGINVKENFFNDSVRYLDLAYITLQHNQSGLKLIEQSGSVEFPKIPVETVFKKGVDKYTAADFMPEYFKNNGHDVTNLDTKDPHEFLLNNHSNRMVLLSNTLEIIFSRSLSILKYKKY